MLSNKTCRILTAYLLPMIFLNGYLFCRAWTGVGEGWPDFVIFYTAARMTEQGKAADLYDWKSQTDVQQRFAAVPIQRRGSVLPYNHPPFELLLVAPFAIFSYFGAYIAWLAFNLSLLAVILLLLRKNLRSLAELRLYLIVLALFAYYPVVLALLQGQDSILMLFFYVMAFLALKRGADFRAGLWLSAVLCKFQLILPFIVPFLFVKRFRVFSGWLAGGALLTLAGLLITGWRAFVKYPAFAMGTEFYIPGGLPNLRSLVWSLSPRDWRLLCLVLLSTAILGVMSYTWNRAAGIEAATESAFALSLIGTVLLSYHLYAYDLSVVILPVVIAIDASWSRPRSRSVYLTILICIGILFCSPLFILLSIRMRQMQIFAIVLLAFFIALMKTALGQAKNTSTTSLEA